MRKRRNRTRRERKDRKRTAAAGRVTETGSESAPATLPMAPQDDASLVPTETTAEQHGASGDLQPPPQFRTPSGGWGELSALNLSEDDFTEGQAKQARQNVARILATGKPREVTAMRKQLLAEAQFRLELYKAFMDGEGGGTPTAAPGITVNGDVNVGANPRPRAIHPKLLEIAAQCGVPIEVLAQHPAGDVATIDATATDVSAATEAKRPQEEERG